jgi:hypothetical protein
MGRRDGDVDMVLSEDINFDGSEPSENTTKNLIMNFVGKIQRKNFMSSENMDSML